MLPTRLHRVALSLFDGGVLRLIFENVRNMAVSTLITAAGLEVVRTKRGDLDLANSTLVGYVVAGIGVSLLLLNLFDGIWRLSRVKGHVILQIALCVVYAFISFRVAQLVLTFKSNGGFGIGN